MFVTMFIVYAYPYQFAFVLFTIDKAGFFDRINILLEYCHGEPKQKSLEHHLHGINWAHFIPTMFRNKFVRTVNFTDKIKSFIKLPPLTIFSLVSKAAVTSAIQNLPYFSKLSGLTHWWDIHRGKHMMVIDCDSGVDKSIKSQRWVASELLAPIQFRSKEAIVINRNENKIPHTFKVKFFLLSEMFFKLWPVVENEIPKFHLEVKFQQIPKLLPSTVAFWTQSRVSRNV